VSSWLVDRYAPGLAVSATWMPFWTLALFLLHRNLKRHITRTTDQQTATLAGAKPETPGGAPMTQAPAPPPPDSAPQHHAVVHPRELLHRQPGIAHRDMLPPRARGLPAFLSGLSTRAAFAVCACYGSAAAIWLFTAYSVFSGLAKGSEQITLLTWSNGVQLVFCAVGTYVGIVTQKQGQAKADSDHAALTHIATAADDIKAALGAGKDATP
jgi:hypothetical protein